MKEQEETWTTPFCANLAEGLVCPACKAQAVFVREHDNYWEGDCVEAFCDECHAMIEVCAAVEITFSDPELAL